MSEPIQINRAPVLTLWAAVVAEALGYRRDEALSLGKTLAGLNAQSKGRRLGIYQPSDAEQELDKKRRQAPEEVSSVDLLGRNVPVTHTQDGLRALAKDEPVDPKSAERYLKNKFGDRLEEAWAAMAALAAAFPPEKLASRAYDLYEQFRPKIPEGARGWGAAGPLDLDQIRKLAGKG